GTRVVPRDLPCFSQPEVNAGVSAIRPDRQRRPEIALQVTHEAQAEPSRCGSPGVPVLREHLLIDGPCPGRIAGALQPPRRLLKRPPRQLAIRRGACHLAEVLHPPPGTFPARA